MKRSKDKIVGIGQGYLTVDHTDHLNSVRLDPLPPGKLLRWWNFIDDGCSKTQALAGRANPAGDCMSRSPEPIATEVVASIRAGLVDGPDFRYVDGQIFNKVRILMLPGYHTWEFVETEVTQSLQLSSQAATDQMPLLPKVYVSNPPFYDGHMTPFWLHSSSHTANIGTKSSAAK